MSEKEYSGTGAPHSNFFGGLRPYRIRFLLAAIIKTIAVGLTLSIPVLLGLSIDALAGDNAASLVPQYALAMGVAAGLMALSLGAARVLFSYGGVKVQCDLQSQLFSHLLRLDSSFYRSHKIGDLLVRLSEDSRTISIMAGWGVHMLLEAALLFSGAIILMLRLDTTLTLLVLLPYPFIVLVNLVIGPKIQAASMKAQEQFGAINSLMEEDLGGVALIKSYSQEHSRKQVHSIESSRLVAVSKRAFLFQAILMPCFGIIGGVAITVLFIVGGNKVIAGSITLGQFVEFHAYLLVLMMPSQLLGQVLALNQEARSSWVRISEILETRPLIADGSSPALLPQEVDGEVEFRNLTVKVDEAVLVDNVSLTIESGTSIAIVGRTGSGKSSLISTLPRLLGAPAGSVFVDGHDINDLPLANLRSCVGYAPQEAFLFSTTIANNIRHGVERQASPPTDEAGIAAAIQEAAVAAGLERDLKALPKGLDTIVGERGISLSGGQRQRVALARTLATKPKILVLDDSLSSVDAETEQLILEGLKATMNAGTAIILSHRLTAIRSADQIAVLEGGRLVEQGTHEDLLAKRGSYCSLYETQLGDGSAHDD